MDKIAKALKKFSAKERKTTKVILEKIKKGDFEDLKIKKLKTRRDVYRIRKGDIRIIYRVQDRKITLLTVERRSDNTYK